MAKHILKYKLHGGSIPWYISEPGILVIGEWFVGVSKDDTECYIPSEIEKITKAGIKNLMTNVDFKIGKTFSKQEKDEYIDKVFEGKI